MENRHLLCQQNIEDFRAFLIEKGYIVEEPVGEYEELRAKRPGGKNPVIVYRRIASNGGGPLVHFTVQTGMFHSLMSFSKAESRSRNTDFTISNTILNPKMLKTASTKKCML